MLNKLTKEVPSEETISRTEERFFSLKDCIDVKEFIAGWFGGVDPHVLGRGNIEDFVAYGFHNRSLQDVDAQVSPIMVWLWLSLWLSCYSLNGMHLCWPGI